MEEYAIVLDYLPQGMPGGFNKNMPICYALGESEFKLFELTVKAGAKIAIDDRVYIGKDQNLRVQIDHVKRRVSFDQMSGAAQSELEPVVRELVIKDEAKYIKFYNEAQPISLKVHLLEELPGMGKKTVAEVLKDRDKNGPFKSFDDMATRVPVVKDPAKYIADRIVLEISDRNRRNYLFIMR